VLLVEMNGGQLLELAAFGVDFDFLDNSEHYNRSRLNDL